ncbi:MAG: transposase [Rhodospirillales bacterium]|nr:transposase [Rhodospirillales bacterium]
MPANAVLQERIGWLLKRPVGRPPHAVRRYYASFSDQAASWNKPRRVVAKVEWHPRRVVSACRVHCDQHDPAAGTGDAVLQPARHGGAAHQGGKERGHLDAPLSCRRFTANAVRLQLHALAYNLANFLRTLALPEAVSHRSMTTLRDRPVKIGAKSIRHGRSITFQMAEVMVPRALFQQILDAIAMLRPLPPVRC